MRKTPNAINSNTREQKKEGGTKEGTVEGGREGGRIGRKGGGERKGKSPVLAYLHTKWHLGASSRLATI